MRYAWLWAAVAVVILVTTGAWAQEGALQVNPIEVLKARGLPEMSVAAARDLLVKRAESDPESVVKAVATLLEENDVQVRINAAVVLARIAARTTAPSLPTALQQCYRDSSLGVRYWGLRGLLAEKQAGVVPTGEVLANALQPNQSRVLHLLGAEVAAERRIQEAVVPLMALLQDYAKAYEEARTKLLTVTLPPGMEGAPTSPGGPPVLTPAEGAGFPGKMMEREEPPPPGPVRPVALAPAATTRINIATLTREERQKLAERFDENQAVTDLRWLGSALEQITGQDWGFLGERPALPWDLGGCVVKAVGWFQASRGKPGSGVAVPEKGTPPAKAAPPAAGEPGKAASK